MNKVKRSVYISGIIIAAGALIGSLVFMKLYNKPHTDVHRADPDYTLTATTLIEAFKTDETGANGLYLDKILQVEGVIKDISIVDGNSVITLGVENSGENIICNMYPTENKKALGLHKGQKIKVKGICTGFLLDVILVRAVIIN
ncbi:OB-fold protein [Sinomicrobium sp. M5D2P17]